MKVFSLIAICILVVVNKAFGQYSEPAPYNPCTPQAIAYNQLYHSHPNSLVKYIQCDLSGQPIVQYCAFGTVWNPAANTCTTVQELQGTITSYGY